MAPAKDKWIRRFIIPETTRHKKGFTIYKVTSMVFLNSSHEEISKVSVWKRYNDFKKLHSELSSLYKQLGVKESFPTFPKSKYFGRFEAEIIEERRKYALKFLEFVGKYSYLYSSDIFITFFETSHIDNYSSDCAHSLSSDTSEDDRIVVLNNSFANDTTAQHALQAPCLSKTSGNTSTSSCSTLSSVASTNEKEFAASRRKNESQSTNLDNIGVKKGEERNCKTTKQCTQDAVTKDCNVLERNKTIDRNNIATLNNELRFDGLNNNVDENLTNCKAVHSACSVTLYKKASLSQVEAESTQYILIAAGHMSAAFKHESIAEYQEAFIQYKLGISCLINGVQSDPDDVRATSIKDKISKYLTRAEQLYNRHLNCNISLMNKPVSELQYYKVLKIMKTVMLVMDIRVNCNRIIKTVEKSPVHDDNINKYILHGQIPHMVHLYACIETDTTVFLILQYASCGKLWDFIRLHYKISNNLHIDVIPDPIFINNQVNEESNGNENVIHEPDKEDEEKILENSKVKGRDHSCLINGQDEIYNMEVPTTQLLEKSQKLLQSVNATLRRGNSITSRLNKSKELRNSENTLSPSKSQESDLILPDTCHDKLSDLHSINISDVIINENLSRRFVENKDFKGTNPLSTNNSKNSAVTENTRASALNRNCAILGSFKDDDSFCDNPTSKTSAHYISTNKATYKNIKSTSDEKTSSNIYHNINVNNNLSDKKCDVYKTQYSYLCKENSIDEEQELWQIPETVVCTWAAEILSALETLHQQDVLIFDFKPDNILLDDAGHVQLTYIVPGRNMEPSKLTYPYSSPELITFSPTILVTSATDIWSFGVILYELLTGLTFTAEHPGLFHSHSTISIPSELSENAKSLLCSILKYHPDERLTTDKIKRHPFFAKIDWSSMASFEM